ncbi:uncharacterized protein [Hetaerina americana]|uniref:uncharacterized protein n=1 Tax=Hetaerina americana TaxID=62018 RepID=UPI003A7F5D07
MSATGSMTIRLPPPLKPRKELFVLDVDTGSDDALGILMMASKTAALDAGIEVMAITCVNGNTHIDNVVVNVLKTLKVINRLDIPVYRGSTKSLQRTPPTDNFFGVDGFGDFFFEDAPDPREYLQKEHAVSALIRMVLENPGKVNILAIGPLTNIALAVRLQPDFLKMIKRLYVLGGAVNGVGNIKPGVEFNFYMDPLAVDIVLNETVKPICLIPWETVKINSYIDMAWRKNVLGKVESPAVRLLNLAEKISSKSDDEQWISSDSLAAWKALNVNWMKRDGSTCGGIPMHATVVTGWGDVAGALLVDYANNTGMGPNIEIVEEIDVPAFKDMVIRTSAQDDTGTCSTRLECWDQRPVGKLVMDVDVGNDDAWAIVMAASEHASSELGAEVIALTCVNGNTEVDNVVVNVLKLLKTMGRLDIPVYRGASRPLLHQPENDYYYGKDGFGDVVYDDPPKVEDYLKKEHAVNALIRMATENPGEITLVALGPLTNVALAVRMDPTFLNKLKRLVVLGGSVRGIGNIFPGVEFNFYYDPHAAQIVFNSTSKPICLFPWEAALDSTLTADWRKNILGNIENPNVSLLNKTEHMENYTKDFWLISDGFATAAVLRPDLILPHATELECGSRKFYVSIESEGINTKGIVLVDYKNLTMRMANAEIVDHIDRDKFKALILSSVRS